MKIPLHRLFQLCSCLLFEDICRRFQSGFAQYVGRRCACQGFDFSIELGFAQSHFVTDAVDIEFGVGEICLYYLAELVYENGFGAFRYRWHGRVGRESYLH